MPQVVADALRNGAEVSDAMFDLIYPPEHRRRSWVHWTPLDVALRASALLAPYRGARVLDIGAGVGKLCVVGALTAGATWCGVELDGAMVDAATMAATLLGVQDRATFVHGDARSVDWSEFDAFYLFNPFLEGLLGDDEDVDALDRRERYVALIEDTQHRLAAAAPGTRVVTYHGFGGDMPPPYQLVHREVAHEDELKLWVRRG